MPFDPSQLSQAMRKLNPHLTNPVTCYTPLDDFRVLANPMKPRARKAVEKYPALIPFLVSHGLPVPVREKRFHPVRLWRFDFAWPHPIRGGTALEIEGGAYVQGRHNRGASFVEDMNKYSTAASLGWLVIRRTPEDAMTMETIKLIGDAMEKRAVAL